MAEVQEVQAQRKAPKTFIKQTFEMVNNPDNNNLIAWTPNGNSFIIKDKDEFSRNLLPKYFTHNKFESFVRQLNYYGFNRVNYGFYEYWHDSFRRGSEHRLWEIHSTPKKKKSTRPADNVQLAAMSSNTVEGQAVVSSTSLPGDGALDAEIVSENKRLRQENAALKHELQRVRSMCHYVAGLVKDLAGAEPVSAVRPHQEGRGNSQGGLDV